MALGITRETTIGTPREQVWRYLTDFARHAEWADPRHKLRLTPPRDVRVGATFTSIGKDMGRDSKNAVTITEVVPGERIEYVATQDDGTVWRNIFELSDTAEGTRVTKRNALVSARFPMSVVIAIFGRLAQVEGAKAFEQDLARIKANVERASMAVAS
jgi:uncharacterized protein YndB with AHSA1/START domain